MMAVDFEAVRREHPLEAEVSKMLPLKRAGANKVACCPFHADQSPSFVVFKDQTYHCFGCGAHGDVIDFIAGTQHLTISDAIKFLTGGNAPSLDAEDQARRDRESREREAQHQKRQENATLDARGRWARAAPVNGEGNPYLLRKNVAPYGTRCEGDNLLVPIYDRHGLIMSLQSIAPDGSKLFHAGAPVRGGAFTLGDATDGPLVIAEGFATGATIQAATGFQVIVGFSKGALVSTAAAARRRFPDRLLIVAADSNGVEAAAEAAENVDGKLVEPDLRGAEGSDFNDQAGHYGLEDVAQTFAAVVPRAPTLAVFSPAEWDGHPPRARQWRWDGFIPDFQATLLTGAGAAGKSLATQQMSTCIALGLPFLGTPTKRCPALYITCEDDMEELHRRQAAICDKLGVSLESTRGHLFLLSLQGAVDNELARFSPEGKMTIAPRYGEIEQTCLALDVGHVTIDNTAHTFAGNENDRHQVAAFVNLNNKLAQRIGGSVIMVGHPNKAGDSYSGSTAWENQVRSRLYLEIPKNGTDEGAVPIDPDMRVLRNEKANYSQRGAEVHFYWVDGAFATEEELPGGNRDSSIHTSARADYENGVFLTLLDQLTDQRRNVSHSPNAGVYAPKIMAAMPGAKGLSKASLARAMERLFNLDEIAASQPLWEGKDRHPVIGLARK